MPAFINRRQVSVCGLLAASGAVLAGCAGAGSTTSASPPARPSDGAGALPQLPVPARTELPSLVLVGDSTVRNGRDDGQGRGPLGQWGWGHVLARLIDNDRMNVVNRAIGGLSSRTYRSGGHWARTLALVRAGDLVLIQFGHNDGSPVNDAQRARGTLAGTGDEQQVIDNLLTGQRETVRTYGAYLREYIADCRAVGARPVLVTPVPRNRRDAAGRTLRGVGGHAGWAAAVARETGVPLIDLDAEVAARYDALGPVVVDGLFPRTTPEDRVHTNWAGAALNARQVHAALGRLAGQGLLPAAALQPPRPALTVDAPVNAAPASRDTRRPALVLVGDSTVRSAGVNGHWGWGDRLQPWLNPERLQLVNRAMAGRSSRSYLREGRWDAVRALLQPGDVVLIQFGHNDGGRVGDPAARQRGALPGAGAERAPEPLPDGRIETVHSFGVYLARYLRDALDAGAVPVVLSPVPHKDRWQQGRDFEDIAAWGRTVAQQEGALFIDLTLRVAEAYREIGPAAVDGLFADARTHTNDKGARFNAACVAAALRGMAHDLFAQAILDEPAA